MAFWIPYSTLQHQRRDQGPVQQGKKAIWIKTLSVRDFVLNSPNERLLSRPTQILSSAPSPLMFSDVWHVMSGDL
jgi:hypothetical protein